MTATLGARHGANAAPPARLDVVEESDGYTAAVAGITVESVRIGQGRGPNIVLGAPGRKLAVTSSHFGFPMASHSYVPDDCVVAAYVHRNPAGSRWCGVPLEEGSVVIYAPGSEHAAINRSGLHFTFAITQTRHLAEVAEHCGFAASFPHSGLHRVPPGAARRLGERIEGLARAALAGEGGRPNEDTALVTLAETCADLATGCRPEVSRGLDSRKIVAQCIDFADTVGRIPSVAELCLAAHVSERRLRSAFTEEFDRPPSRYFRLWALDRAHRRLRRAAVDQCTVSRAACDLGFEHLGRFSGWYREIYGETPSATLQGG